MFIVDLGELEEALMTIHGVAEGFAGMKSVNDIGGVVKSGLLKDFGEHADAAAAEYDSRIGHVYEWGSETDRKVANSEIRLWFTSPASNTANDTITFGFHQSTVPVPLEGPTDVPRAEHIWHEKAYEQEYHTSWQFSAGGPAKTRISPGVSQYLYITDMRGEPMFRKTWITYSKYTNNFRTFFNAYWAMAGEEAIEKDLQRRLERDFEPEVEKMLNDRIKRGYHPPTRVDPTANPLKVTVKGRPMSPRGLNTKPPREIVNRTRGVLKRVMRK